MASVPRGNRDESVALSHRGDHARARALERAIALLPFLSYPPWYPPSGPSMPLAFRVRHVRSAALNLQFLSSRNSTGLMSIPKSAITAGESVRFCSGRSRSLGSLSIFPTFQAIRADLSLERFTPKTTLGNNDVLCRRAKCISR